MSAALHNLSSSGNTENTKETSVTGSTTGFHVYSVNWTAEKIEFSVDGMVFYSYNPTVKTNENWPYTAPQFLILNLAMAGSLGGDIPADFTESKLEIDYVRISHQKTS
ncbi:family 16 glycosylhydrolase [Flavobacteriaceae bacterium]|nr:family 16 glycosylhydrolase [Flavobacteriaceae bacterium]